MNPESSSTRRDVDFVPASPLSKKTPGRPPAPEPKRMDIRPIRREDLQASVDRSEDEDVPMSAAAMVGQEPYTIDTAENTGIKVVPHSEQRLNEQLKEVREEGIPDSAVASNEPYTLELGQQENGNNTPKQDEPPTPFTDYSKLKQDESPTPFTDYSVFRPAEAPGFNGDKPTPDTSDADISDIVSIDANGRGHEPTQMNVSGNRSGGQFISEENMDTIRANADFIRNNLPGNEPTSTPEPTPTPNQDGGDGIEVIPHSPKELDKQLEQASEDEIPATAVATNEPWTLDVNEDGEVKEEGPEEEKQEGPIKLYALDTTDTDTAEAARKAAIRLESEVREIREKLFPPGNPQAGRFAKLVRAISMPIRAAAHPKEFFTYLAKSSAGKDYYLQKYRAESLSGMDGFDYHSEIARDVAERFDAGEYVMQNGERKLAEDVPEVREVKDKLNEVFRLGIIGTMDRDSVLTEAKRIVAEAPWLQGNSEESLHLIQNLEETYDRITTAVEHESGLAAIDAAYELVGGEVTIGVNAEVQKTATDRIMEKLTNSPLKALIVNEATVGMAVGAVVGTVGYLMKSKGVRVATAAVVGGPVAMVATAGASALFAYGREKMRMRQDRMLHMAERAVGGEGPEGNTEEYPRRVEMEGVIYEMASAQDIMANFEELMPEDPSTMTEDEARAVQSWLIALRTNQAVGDQHNVDLIQYSNEDSVESEKNDLFQARARAQVALRQFAQSHPDFMDQIPGADYDEKLDFLVGAQTEQLVQGEMADKDRAFRKLSRSRATKRAVATFAFALAGSYISQQLTQHFMGGGETVPKDPGILSNEKTVLSMRGDSIDMPQGWSIRGNVLVDAKGEAVINNFQYNPDGSLSQDTIMSLQGKGFRFSETMTNHTSVTTREVPYDEYVRLNPDKFAPIHREGWMGNDTPMYRGPNGKLLGADLNELRADFKLSPDGDIVLDTSRMTNNGSFWGAVKVAAHSDQLDGKLRWLLTPDKNNQGSSMVLEVSQGGQTVIPKNSEMFKLFSVSPEGKVDLNSGFAEVGVPTGRSTDGAINFYVLATETGNNPPGMMPITETNNFSAFHGTIVVPETPDPVVDPFVPFIPISGVFPRKPLEKIIPGGGGEPYIDSPYNGYQSGEFAPEDEEKRRKGFSERLRNNPDAVLDPRTEIEDYIGRMDSERREALEGMVEKAEPMSETVKIVVAIPVNGSQEGKNIYKTLQWYSGQVDADGNPLDPSSYEIVLYVNKPTDREWDETASEIQRFMADHPDMPIRLIQREYKPSEARIGRIRRDMTDLTLARQAKRSSDEDLVIVSNDADCKGLGESYIATIMEQVDAQSVDGLSGRLEWDPATNTESPLYHMVRCN
jgi:hypothetical protein